MQHYVQQDSSNLILVVAPTSIVPEWGSQLQQWCPSLSKIIVRRALLGRKQSFSIHRLQLAGDADQREALKQSLNASRLAVFGQSAASAAFSVLVLSYETLLREGPFLQSFKWKAVVFDEAHRLKNPKSKTYQCVQEYLRYDKAILLTGTPVQNTLSELYALLCLVQAQVFPANEEATAKFVQGMEGADGQLGQLISASILRRTVASTSLQLPSLRQVVVPCPLTPLQRKLYLSALHHNVRHVIAASESGASVGNAASLKLQNVVSVLQTVCNHPYLVAGVEPEPFEEGEHIVHASSKLDVLDQLLRRLIPGGHRVLVFSHFARTLDVLQDYCNMRQYSFERLDGSVRGDERWDAVKRFQSSDTVAAGAGPSVFLLSTRAGGQGLTLTKADTVVLFDSGMNPQWDEQAIKRAHRMGQTAPVLVLRLATQGTAEEVILARGMRKLQLSQKVMQHTSAAGATAAYQDGEDGDEASSSDLLSAIRCGAAALLSQPGAAEDADDVAALSMSVRRPEVSSCALSEAEVQHILSMRTSQALARAASASATSAADSEDPVASVPDTSHVYVLDGVDYSSKVAASGHQDTAAWDAWAAKQAARKRTEAAVPGHPAATPMSAEERAAAQLAAVDARKEKVLERWRKQQEHWEDVGYRSLAVEKPRPGESERARGCTVEELGWAPLAEFTFLHGNVAKPAVPAQQQTLHVQHEALEGEGSQHAEAPALCQVLVHCVDNSGIWARGGVFSAIDVVDPSGTVAKAYAEAKARKDLHLGDAHLVPMTQEPAESGAPQLFCALLVCLQRSQAGKRPRHGGGGGGGISLNTQALSQGLGRLAAHVMGDCKSRSMAQHSYTLHCPRIGAGIRGTSYYAVERYLRRHFLDNGLHTSVYYYRRPGRQLGAADAAALRAAMVAGARHMQGGAGQAHSSSGSDAESAGVDDDSESAEGTDSDSDSAGSAMVSLGSDDGDEDGDGVAGEGASGSSDDGGHHGPKRTRAPASKRARRAPLHQEAEDPGMHSNAGGAAAASCGGAGLPPGPQSAHPRSSVQWWLLEAAKQHAETEFPKYIDNIHFVWDKAHGDPAQQASVREAMANVQQGAAAAAQCGQPQRAKVLSFFGKVMQHALSTAGSAAASASAGRG